MAKLDRELVALARGGSALRLRLGDVLAELVRCGGHEKLGFSSIDACVRERCGVDARWAADSRALVRKLEGLPRLREALFAGEVGWCMAEVVAAHATPENEAFVVKLARRSTVRRMKALLAEAGQRREDGGAAGAEAHVASTSEGDIEPPDDWVRVRRFVAREAATLFVDVRELVRCHVGSCSADVVWEALLAEGMHSLVGHVDERVALRVARRASHGVHVDDSEAPERQAPRVEMRFGPLPDSPRALDREARWLAQELGRRELRIGELALELREMGGFRSLGYASEAQYCQERLGRSHASIKSRQWLAKHASRFPELWEAVEAGQLGLEAARLVTRVATQDSVVAWIDHATRRTFKHLRQDVEQVEMAARIRGEVPAGPPFASSGMTEAPGGANGQMFGGADTSGGESSGEPDASGVAGQMFGGAATQPEADDDPTAVRPARMGRVSLAFTMSREVAALFVVVEDAWRRAGCPLGDFLAFLCAVFVRTWEADLSREVTYGEVYWRDGWQCTSPTCERRDVTPHHLVLRSHGGGHAPENVKTLCRWCHLEGIHTLGSIRALGPASAMVWKTPVLEVRGREVVWSA